MHPTDPTPRPSGHGTYPAPHHPQVLSPVPPDWPAQPEAPLHFVASHLPGVLWSTDTALVVTLCQGAGLAALGLSPGQLVGTRLFDYLQTDDPDFPPLAAHFRALRGDTVGCEFEWQGRDYQVEVEPLRDAGGAVAGCLGLALDVTERKQAELRLRALRAGEDRYRRIIETAAEGIVMLDAEGQVSFANGRMARLLRSSAGRLVGLPLLSLVAGDSRAVALSCLRHNRQGAEEHRDFRFRREDGTTVATTVSASPWLDENGRYAGALLMVTDTTERQQLEEQLRQAQKMEAVGRLAGGVAHDFNNLLTVMVGYSEVLLRDLPPGHPTRALAEEIRQAGERAASLTRQLLAFSRRQAIAPEVLDLNAVLRRAQRMLDRILGEDVELVVVPEPALGRVEADPGQVEQVIMNLAANARDAMPRGGKFTLRTANVVLREEAAPLRPGACVLLEASDTGCGMDAETKSHLFEPFFTTKGPGYGTGLGLATAYGVVKQAGGHIEVESEPGRGTTFKVYFPRSRASLPGAAVPPVEGDPRRGSETVLVVEDDEAVRAVVRHVLRGAGYTVLEARRGAEAVRACEQHAGPVHLVLTDVVLPGEGGHEVAERVRALRPGARVLFMSGYTEDALRRHGVRQREVAFLRKPFTPAALERQVREVLDAEVPV